jgi:predicted ATPase
VLVSASTAALLDANALRDLGEHRLKDLSAPEKVYQLGEEDFPPLKSLHQTNLPIPSTPFLGREQELADVLGLLSQDDIRLLTLTGAGGTGKTRLGLQAAGGLADRYQHGVWWVPLATLRDPALVRATAAQALGAKNGLAEHIGDKRMLLLFDNFEHMLEAAVEVANLLATCPNLDLLVTSREPLHVTGEQEYSVQPLVHEEGVGFFLARARAVEPTFVMDEAVPEICRRLDDLPLALELAAARVKALSARQILERLERRLPLLTGGARDVPDRQRTLRATIEWSYDLLTPAEQHLFARLAVFNGGCTLEAAEEVAEADLDTLQSLVAKSLVRHNEDRYWLLETIREYAVERLEASGEGDDLRRQQAEHVVAFTEQAAPHLRRTSTEWLERLEDERDNVRAALSWLLDASRGEDALEILASTGRFWWVRGPAEGLAWLENAVASPGASPERLALALEVAGGCAWFTGDAERALEFFEEGLSRFRELGDRAGVAMMLTRLGPPLQAVGRDEEAEAVVRQSLAVHRELGEKGETMLALHMLGAFASERGDRNEARLLLEEAAAICHELGDTFFLPYNLLNLAEVALEEGDLEYAEALSREGLDVARDIGDEMMEVYALALLSISAARRGELALAGRLWGAAERHEQELGPTLVEIDDPHYRELLGEPGPIFERGREKGRAMALDEAVALALGSVD